MATKKKPSNEPTEEQIAVVEEVREEAFTPPAPEPAPESVDEELEDFLEKAKAQYLAERQKALEPKVLCRHENKHSIGLKGVLESLFCDLPLGHEGNHEADFAALRQDDGSYEDSLLEHQKRGTKEFVIKTVRAYWLSDASIPAKDIKPDLAQLAILRQTRQPGIDGKLYEESHRSR